MRRRQQLIMSRAKSEEEEGEGEKKTQTAKRAYSFLAWNCYLLQPMMIVRLKFIHFSHNLTFNRYQENIHICTYKLYID